MVEESPKGKNPFWWWKWSSLPNYALLFGGIFVAVVSVYIIVKAITGDSSPRDGLPVPPLTGRVVDLAEALSPDSEAEITEALIHLEEKTGGQMAVLLLPTLQEEPIEDFSIRVANEWELGQKGEDNGALLVLAMADRTSRLEIGYGWEPMVTDARAGDLLRGIRPYFQVGDYKNGILSVIYGVISFVTGEEAIPTPEPEAGEIIKPEENKLENFLAFLLLSGVGLLFFGFFFRGFFSSSGGDGGSFGSSGGFSGGGGGSSGGGGFSGGGGSFGGGGASGSW